MKKVSGPQVVTTTEAVEASLSAEIQRKRSASWSGQRGPGFSRMRVGLGLGVVRELMEREVEEVVGPKGKHEPGRTASVTATRTGQ
jgi:hypothetical protein